MAEPYLTQLQQIIKQLGSFSDINVTLDARHFFSGAALYANGKICASFSPAGFALKLPKETRLNLLSEGKAAEFRFFPTGPVKKEYVAVSDSVLGNDDSIKELINLSVSYVAGNIDPGSSVTS